MINSDLAQESAKGSDCTVKNRFINKCMQERTRVSTAALAVLVTLAAMPILGVIRLDTYALLIPAALLGAYFHKGLVRRVFWVLASLFCATIFLIAFTPIIDAPASRLVRQDKIEKADAVVVLSAAVLKDGRLNRRALERLLEGMLVVQQGYAPVLVRTNLGPTYPSPDFDVKRLMTLVEDVACEMREVGPVGSTRDEAVAVARLAKTENWRRIILVTSPSHSHRAAAVFEKVGMNVISRPCMDREVLLTELESPKERVVAFWGYFYEMLALAKYKIYGWV